MVSIIGTINGNNRLSEVLGQRTGNQLKKHTVIDVLEINHRFVHQKKIIEVVYIRSYTNKPEIFHNTMILYNNKELKELLTTFGYNGKGR